MNNQNLYIDFHILQTVPPSCVNRDDTGSPKTAVYGGAMRARVSSQAWKRAIRLMFRETMDAGQLGMRTKRIVGLVAGEIRTLKPNADAEKLAAAVLKTAGLSISEDNLSDALFFMSAAQARALAKLAVKGNADKKACQAALAAEPSIDIALFGRMVASDPSLNYDAAAQVAHSISTHAVHNEYDYFTAVDDCAPKDNAGAGHLGTVEFASATLYRYATVNVRELSALLGRDSAAAVRAFADALIRSMPTGRQNTFANRTLPDFVYVTLRRDQPVNLCGAFEKPVAAGGEGYVAESEKRLANNADRVYRSFVPAPEKAYCVGGEMGKAAETLPLGNLLDALEAQVGKSGLI